jgi:hypothetical protein
MYLGKLFILVLLALLHFANAHAMEKENDLGDIIENIKSIKVVDRPDITYDGRIGHGTTYHEGLDLYKYLSTAIKLVKDYFVYSEEDTKTYKHRESPRLYDLCFTRWERDKPTKKHKTGLIVLWDILPRSGYNSTSKDPQKQLYATMRQQSYMMSIGNLLTHMQEDNDLYYYEIFPSILYRKLKEKKIQELRFVNGFLINL